MLAVLLAALNLLRPGVDGDDKLTRRAVAEAGIATCAHRTTTPVCFGRRRATVAFCWRELRDCIPRGLTYISSTWLQSLSTSNKTRPSDRLFTVADPRMWNMLIASLRLVDSYTSLRRWLNAHLFDQGCRA